MWMMIFGIGWFDVYEMTEVLMYQNQKIFKFEDYFRLEIDGERRLVN